MPNYERFEDIPLWEADKYLTTPERIASYIEAVLEDDDPALLAKAIEDTARASGMSEPSSDRLQDQLGTLMDVLRPLGLRLALSACEAQPHWSKREGRPARG